MDSLAALKRSTLVGGNSTRRLGWGRCTFMILVAVGIFAPQVRAQARMTEQEMLASNVIRFQDSSGLLRRAEPEIRATIDSALRRVSRFLPISAVDITVFADAHRAIPGYGVGGFTPVANSVQISIDPAFVNSTQLLAAHVTQTVVHELHHAMRERGPGYGRSLLEALVSEGLADHFAVEVLGIQPPPWTHALSSEQSSELLGRARAQLDDVPYDHARWFFGSAKDVPLWTGYTLGYQLVTAYLERHPGQSATSLVDVPAREFRP
jgi:uncharacterized protein YjaZ